MKEVSTKHDYFFYYSAYVICEPKVFNVHRVDFTAKNDESKNPTLNFRLRVMLWRSQSLRLTLSKTCEFVTMAVACN